jgi:hypothetical protein
MARRHGSRSGLRRHTASDRPKSLGSHWRADGAPKTAYGSQGEALGVADEQRQDFGVDLNVYRCDVCSSWHMGNADRRHG